MSYCQQNRISILAYSPMAQGLLTGKFAAGHEFKKEDNRIKNILFEPKNHQHVRQALDRLRPIAEKNKASLAQLALAWVSSHIDTYAIAGARNADQVIQNARSAEVELSENDLTRIDEIGRLVTDHLDENPVMWR
jgi:aryl-alcohol dehydrogenase-like predicted oxidoreductase